MRWFVTKKEKQEEYTQRYLLLQVITANSQGAHPWMQLESNFSLV